MSNAAFQSSPDSYDASVPIPTSVQPTSTHLPVQPLSPLLFAGPTLIGPGPMQNSESEINQDPEYQGGKLTRSTGPSTGRSRRFWIVLGLVIGLLVTAAIGVGVGVSTSHHNSSNSGPLAAATVTATAAPSSSTPSPAAPSPAATSTTSLEDSPPAIVTATRTQLARAFYHTLY